MGSAPERWSESWQVVVLMRHLHGFLTARAEFAVAWHNEVLTVAELREVRVKYTGNSKVVSTKVNSGWPLDAGLRNLLGGRSLCLQQALGHVRGDEIDAEIEKEWWFD